MKRTSLQRDDSGTSQNRRGFTLVELLVVSGIVALLAGLLAPAIQSVRGASHRVACASKEKQVGMAIHSYHQAKNILPPQVGWSGGVGKGGFGTLFFHILPYLEEQPLYVQSAVADFGAPSRVLTFDSGGDTYTEYAGTYDSRHSMGSSRLTIHKQIVRSYRCPAESSGDFTGPQLGWASGNYASNFQVFGNSDSVQLSPMLSTSNKKLLSQWQGRKSYSRIRDGLSATIAMAEKFAACRSTEPGISGYGGCMWARWDAFDLFQPTFAASAEHIGAASLFQNNPQPASTPGPCIAGLSQTAHTGGVMNCAMLDGSVRPVTSLIDTAAWWALCTPNGQETIPLGD